MGREASFLFPFWLKIIYRTKTLDTCDAEILPIHTTTKHGMDKRT